MKLYVEAVCLSNFTMAVTKIRKDDTFLLTDAQNIQLFNCSENVVFFFIFFRKENEFDNN